MKKIIFILFFIIYTCEFIVGQCVSIEFSISWKNDNFVFKGKGSTYCYPSLEILYRNNSPESLYFLKVLHPYNGLPRTFSLMYVEPRYRENLPLDYNETDENYTVYFSDDPFYNQLWEVRNDTINIYDEYGYATDLINDNLYWVYRNIFDTLSWESTSDFKIGFQESDFIFEDYPNDNVRNQFVFLKPGESYTDTVNLIGFLLSGGNYTFKLNSDILKNYVLGQSTRNANGEVVDTKIFLPPYIKEYKLYDGEIRTNEVRICLKKEK
jgi:hypothetical protein